MSINDFIEFDRSIDLLPFVADAYESFHLTGDLDIFEEVDDYDFGDEKYLLALKNQY